MELTDVLATITVYPVYLHVLVAEVRIATTRKKQILDDEEDSSDDEDCGDRDFGNIFDILNSQFNSED